ncbi:MAG: cobalamin B12-binding domain-containing protein [Ruminococcus sp.]|jgi:methylmalonyl-CoA mutase cobalamin-binding subunit
MNQADLEYLRSLKPKDHPDGRKMLEEGLELGKKIKAGRGGFIRSQSKYKNHAQMKRELMKEGKIYWNILLGLATLEEQVEAEKQLYEFSRRTGMQIHSIQSIPSGLVALPPEYRENAPATTSYEMYTPEDYEAQQGACPIDVSFNDYHLASPNGLANTIMAIESGSPTIGEFCQFNWDFYGYSDDVERICNMVRALGVVASKKDEYFEVKTYLDDGYAGYFMDCASYIGYAMLEHYICTTLCGARYVIGFGGLLSENDTRCAIAMALHKVLSTEDQPVLRYLNGSTNLQWDHDIHGNYGVSVPEMLFEILVEKKYHMGLGVNPVSITEKIKVPTLQELEDIFAAGKRAEEKADEWIPYFNFEPLEKMRDEMAEKGRQLFENSLEGFRLAGIDTADPVEMLLVLMAMNPIRYEQMFHATTYGTDNVEVKPFYTTVLVRQTMQMKQEILVQLDEKKMRGSLKGKKVVLGSGDAHTYGLMLVEGVLKEMGADTVNAGVDMDPVDMLDLADEEDTCLIGVSCHNGQALDYGRQLTALAKERGRTYWIFMGGKLNAILPGDSEPVEIADKLEDLGIHSENDIIQTVMQMAGL